MIVATSCNEPEVPVLTVVGHPNKGKSSIVSTLTQDASVTISPRPGTTTHRRTFSFQLDGQELCRIVDTPGFQRPRTVLNWLVHHSQSAADRPETIRKFLETHREDPDFGAECELLTPIVDGSGILYVVDGAVPYGPDYDAEMKILRWTGRPSMALINHIGCENYADQWVAPLSQYFRITRKFNAFSEPFAHQVQLLTGFSELHEPWRMHLISAADSLIARRSQQLRQACNRIATLLEDMLSYRETIELRSTNDPDSIAEGKEQFEARLGAIEHMARLDVERVFHHDHLEREEVSLPSIEENLFSDQTWRLFGLSKDQILAMGAAGGAATGALIDIGAAGLTLFLGSMAGAAVGITGAWLGSRQLIKVSAQGFSLGKHQAVLGPITNIHFPWIILGRAVLHLRLVSTRNHAIREQLQIHHSEEANLASKLESVDKKNLQLLFNKLSKPRTLSPTQRDKLGSLILSMLEP